MTHACPHDDKGRGTIRGDGPSSHVGLEPIASDAEQPATFDPQVDPLPRKRNRRPERRATVIRLGPFVTLTSEDHYLQALKPLGMTRVGFRCLLVSLCVPYIEIGSTRLIDDLSFQIAIRSILRVGEKPFLAPGCHTLATTVSRDHPAYATALQPAHVTEALSTLISELLLTHGLEAKPSSRSAKMASIDAAARLLSAGLASLPVKAQHKVRTRAVENMRRVALDMGLNPSELHFPDLSQTPPPSVAPVAPRPLRRKKEAP